MPKEQNNNFKLDFIGVGAPKCGTTWIAQCLSEHPQICLSKQKEINFFNKYNIGLPNTKNNNHTKSINWYLQHFSHCGQNQIKGEFSTHYIYDNKAAKLIARHFPNIKIIICLRNPADRLYSHFLHIKYKTNIKKQGQKLPSFEKTIKKYPNFITTGFYANYLKNFLKYFQRQNIYIIFYEEIENNPQKVIKKLYSFLEVNNGFLPQLINQNPNPTAKNIKNPLRYNFLILKNRLMNCWLKKKTIKIIKKIGLNKIILKLFINPMDKTTQKLSQNKTSYPPMDKETRKYLQKIYEPHIKELEKMLKKFNFEYN